MPTFPASASLTRVFSFSVACAYLIKRECRFSLLFYKTSGVQYIRSRSIILLVNRADNSAELFMRENWILLLIRFDFFRCNDFKSVGIIRFRTGKQTRPEGILPVLPEGDAKRIYKRPTATAIQVNYLPFLLLAMFQLIHLFNRTIRGPE
jgi:hypothetical protein